jgi:hypothetical protein
MLMAEKSYFHKVALTTKLRLSNGNPVSWIPVGNNVGVLETSDETTISELNAMIERGIGGVTKIDKKKFDDAKKNSSKNWRRKQSWHPTISTDMSKLSPFGKLPKESSKKSPASAAEAKAEKPVAEEPALATGVLPPETPLV